MPLHDLIIKFEKVIVDKADHATFLLMLTHPLNILWSIKDKVKAEPHT